MNTYPIQIRAVSGSGLISKVIQWRTDCDFDHVEFLWPFYGSPEYNMKGTPQGWLGAQPYGGVQIRPYDYIKNSESVNFVYMATEDEMLDMRETALDAQNEPYDYWSIVDDAFNVTLKASSKKHRTICSEFVHTVISSAGVEMFSFDGIASVRNITPRDIVLSNIWV